MMRVADFPRSEAVKGIRWLTEPMLYPDSHGDTWTSTWADDGDMYALADDTLGIGKSCRSNIAIFRLRGSPPEYSVEMVNPMTEYLGLGQVEWNDMWKGCGLASIDGTLYLTVSQHTANDIYSDNVQRAHSACIVRSTDHGLTWSAKPRPTEGMFPQYRFGAPYFVQFGQDYRDAFDEFEEYIHAVSSDGVWNNGNYMTLGRVRRDRIARLDAADWEFCRGVDESGRPAWTSRVIDARPILRRRGLTSMTGVQYVPAIERFIMAQWAYTDQDGPRPWDQTQLFLYEAERPWGPWAEFYTEPCWGGNQAYYNPCLPAKWFEDGGRRMWITMAGNWTNAFHTRDDMPFAYGLILRKLELDLG
jgi:hypothetical protein